MIGIGGWSCWLVLAGVVDVFNLLLLGRVDGVILLLAALGGLQFSERTAVLSLTVDGLVPFLPDLGRIEQALAEVTHALPFCHSQVIQHVLVSDLPLHSLTADTKGRLF